MMLLILHHGKTEKLKLEIPFTRILIDLRSPDALFVKCGGPTTCRDKTKLFLASLKGYVAGVISKKDANRDNNSRDRYDWVNKRFNLKGPSIVSSPTPGHQFYFCICCLLLLPACKSFESLSSGIQA